MSLAAKTLWYIENNDARLGLALDDVAAARDAVSFHVGHSPAIRLTFRAIHDIRIPVTLP